MRTNINPCSLAFLTILLVELFAFLLPNASGAGTSYHNSYPTNYIITTAPAIVTVQFSYSGEDNGFNSEGETGPGYVFAGFGESGSMPALSVTNSAGTEIASVAVSDVTTNVTVDGVSTSPLNGLSVSGSGIGFSMSDVTMSVGGTTAGYGQMSTNFPSFTFGSTTGNANIPLQGTTLGGPYMFTVPTNSAGFQNNSSCTASFSFYASTTGPYTITGALSNGGSSGGGHVGEDYGGGSSAVAVTILSISSNPIVSLPTGSLTATKNSGGADGVTLQWTITPPGQ